MRIESESYRENKNSGTHRKTRWFHRHGFGRKHLLGVVVIAGVILGVMFGCSTKGPSFDPRAPKPQRMYGTNMISLEATNNIPKEWLEYPKDPYTLGPGDRLEIEIIGETGTRMNTFVCPDGKLYYDLLPGMDVWGKTLTETSAMLESGLKKYYARPQVAVSLTAVESKRVWVLGRLNKCGVYSLANPMTIIEAVARAGGLFVSRFTGTTEELADLNHSFIIRKNEMLPINFVKLLRHGDTAQNIYLQPDDFIYLPSSLSQEIHVIGAVRRAGSFGFMDNMCLVGAIAKTLGLEPDADTTHVVIVRGALTSPKIAVVNLKEIMLGKAPDILLESRDIVFVPPKSYRKIEDYGKLAINTFVRTVAANEGGRAGGGYWYGVGVSTPLSK